MSKNSWWQTDTYTEDVLVPDAFMDDGLWGPRGPAFVRVWDNGTTDKGWGLTEKLKSGKPGPGFMRRYMRGLFGLTEGTHQLYQDKQNALAYVMRSCKLLAIDIDGKNGGLEHVSELGFLPRTLAETSKSGNGYHLFYLVEDEWNEEVGFARFTDVISIVQGVDIRYTGCIFHYHQQRWNQQELAPLPTHLVERLTERTRRKTSATVYIKKTLESEDETMVAILQDEILTELAKPIPEGKRNTTLFAIGTKMLQAGIKEWEQKLLDRAAQVGLDDDESDKLIENITKYAE